MRMPCSNEQLDLLRNLDQEADTHMKQLGFRKGLNATRPVLECSVSRPLPEATGRAHNKTRRRCRYCETLLGSLHSFRDQDRSFFLPTVKSTMPLPTAAAVTPMPNPRSVEVNDGNARIARTPMKKLTTAQQTRKALVRHATPKAPTIRMKPNTKINPRLSKLDAKSGRMRPYRQQSAGALPGSISRLTPESIVSPVHALRKTRIVNTRFVIRNFVIPLSFVPLSFCHSPARCPSVQSSKTNPYRPAPPSAFLTLVKKA
jgi:hypothetical protein